MKVEILALCDFAQTDAQGKLTIVGAFDHIFAKEEPVTRSLLAVAARLRFEIDEEGAKDIALTIVDSDGQRILPVLNAKFSVKIREGESTASVNCVMVIPQLKLPKFGDYQLDITVNSKVEAAVPLYVRHRRPAPSNRPA